MKLIGPILYFSIIDSFHPVQIENVGTAIASALSVIFAVFVNFSEYCSKTCKKNKKKNMTNKIVTRKTLKMSSMLLASTIIESTLNLS